MSVNGGDNQEGDPGTALATAPTVIVRSAAGAAVPNVTVTFAVDSGGGTVATPSATTNASGIASPGAWTVGAEEGHQVLLATVAGLTPAKIRATSRIPTTTVNTGTVSTAGGTLTIDRPGQPLHGVTLTTKPNAVTGAAPITLAVASTAGITLKTGITAESPGLLITSTADALGRPALVRFPTSTPPDEHTVLIAHDTRTGQSVILPHQRADETGISALIPALDASIVPEPTGAAATSSLFRGLWAAASRAADDPLLLLMASVIPESQNRDYDSQFKAGQNNWDFTNFAVAWLPFLAGAGGGSPSERVVDIGPGMVATSLWYFKNQRGGPPLYQRFRLQPDQPMSNKVGIRWAALANSFVHPNNSIAIEDLEDLLEGESTAEDQWASLVMLKQSFYLADDRPIPVLLYEVEDIFAEPDDADLDVHVGIATRIIGNEVEIVVPENADAPYRFTVTQENGMTPVRIIQLDGGEYTVRSFFPVLERPLLDGQGVASNWPKVLDETVGDAEGWPVPELHWEKGELDQEKVFIADELTHWWECPSCPDFGIAIPGAPEEADKPQAFQVGRIIGGAMAPLPGRVLRASVTWDTDSVDSDVDPTKTGHVLQLVQSQEGDGFVAGWLDWQTVEYRKVSLHPDPTPVELAGDSTVAFTLAPSQALPAGTTYSWVLRTDDGRDSVASTTPTHTRELEAGTKGKLLIMAHEAGTKRVIARDSVPISPPELEPFWRINTMQDQDNLLESAIDAPLAVLFNRILSAPHAGLIALDDEGGGRTVLRLRVLQSALWDATRCCPPPASVTGELHQSLGIMPEEDQGVGPFFAAWGTNRWSQSTEDLDAGTMSSQYIDGLTVYNVEDAGHQTGPRGVLRLTATRNGPSMSGTITITGWGVDPEDVDGFVDPDELVYRFPFTATRMDAIPAATAKAAAARRR